MFFVFWDSKAPDRIMTTKIFMKKFHPLKNTYGIHDGSQGFPEIPWWDTSCYGLAGGPQAVCDGGVKWGPFQKVGWKVPNPEKKKAVIFKSPYF